MMYCSAPRYRAPLYYNYETIEYRSQLLNTVMNTENTVRRVRALKPRPSALRDRSSDRMPSDLPLATVKCSTKLNKKSAHACLCIKPHTESHKSHANTHARTVQKEITTHRSFSPPGRRPLLGRDVQIWRWTSLDATMHVRCSCSRGCAATSLSQLPCGRPIPPYSALKMVVP